MTSYMRTPPTDSSDRVETSWTVRLYDGKYHLEVTVNHLIRLPCTVYFMFFCVFFRANKTRYSCNLCA